MSYGRTDDILSLVFAMQGSATGISLVDIQRIVGCSRRTAERLRDAALRAFPQIEELTDRDGGRAKRWHLPPGSLDRLLSLNAEELLELRLAADELRHGGLEGRARIVETLALKLRALMPRRVLARIEPDLEALSSMRSRSSIRMPRSSCAARSATGFSHGGPRAVAPARSARPSSKSRAARGISARPASTGRWLAPY
jgi:predicted DNA-binding transcriptional regulator YafY